MLPSLTYPRGMFSIEQNGPDSKVVYQPTDERSGGALLSAVFITILGFMIARRGISLLDAGRLWPFAFFVLACGLLGLLWLLEPETTMEYTECSGKFRVTWRYFFGVRTVFESTMDRISQFDMEYIPGGKGTRGKLFVVLRDGTKVSSLRCMTTHDDTKDALQLLSRAFGKPGVFKSRWMYQDWSEVIKMNDEGNRPDGYEQLDAQPLHITRSHPISPFGHRQPRNAAGPE